MTFEKQPKSNLTTDEFAALSIAACGVAVGWQTRIAKILGVTRRTVVRWLTDGEVPLWADEKLRKHLGGYGLSPFPRDDVIIGDAVGPDGKRREYAIYTPLPLIARVVAVDDDGNPLPEEEPADVLNGIIYSCEEGRYVLCEVRSFRPVASDELVQIFETIADAIDRDS